MKNVARGKRAKGWWEWVLGKLKARRAVPGISGFEVLGLDFAGASSIILATFAQLPSIGMQQQASTLRFELLPLFWNCPRAI